MQNVYFSTASLIPHAYQASARQDAQTLIAARNQGNNLPSYQESSVADQLNTKIREYTIKSTRTGSSPISIYDSSNDDCLFTTRTHGITGHDIDLYSGGTSEPSTISASANMSKLSTDFKIRVPSLPSYTYISDPSNDPIHRHSETGSFLSRLRRKSNANATTSHSLVIGKGVDPTTTAPHETVHAGIYDSAYHFDVPQHSQDNNKEKWQLVWQAGTGTIRLKMADPSLAETAYVLSDSVTGLVIAVLIGGMEWTGGEHETRTLRWYGPSVEAEVEARILVVLVVALERFRRQGGGKPASHDPSNAEMAGTGGSAGTSRA